MMGITSTHSESKTLAVTSMGDDSHVRLDDLHVDAVLLLADDDRPPQFAVLPLLLSAVCRDGVVGLAHPAPVGCIRI